MMNRTRLQQYLTLAHERQQLADLLTESEAMMTAPRMGTTDATRRDTSLENLVIRHVGLEARYRAKLKELDAALEEIEQAIDTLPSRERQLLRWRYIKGLRWEEMSEKMSYSLRQIHRIHRQALDQLEKQI